MVNAYSSTQARTIHADSMCHKLGKGTLCSFFSASATDISLGISNLQPMDPAPAELGDNRLQHSGARWPDSRP